MISKCCTSLKKSSHAIYKIPGSVDFEISDKFITECGENKQTPKLSDTGPERGGVGATQHKTKQNKTKQNKKQCRVERDMDIYEGFRFSIVVNILRPELNGWQFADIFKCKFFNENHYTLIWISLKFVSDICHMYSTRCQQKNKIISDKNSQYRNEKSFWWFFQFWLHPMC